MYIYWFSWRRKQTYKMHDHHMFTIFISTRTNIHVFVIHICSFTDRCVDRSFWRNANKVNRCFIFKRVWKDGTAIQRLQWYEVHITISQRRGNVFIIRSFYFYVIVKTSLLSTGYNNRRLILITFFRIINFRFDKFRQNFT